jgi:trimeric autotransporter adhesin
MRMKRIGISKLIGLATVTGVLAVLTVVGAASAYFATNGIGTGSASAGALSAPVVTSATAGAGTVQLSWSTVAPPAGAGTVKYYVSRSGGAAGGNCPDSTSPGASTSCTDSGLAKGTYSYTVTAVWQSWTATSAPARAVTLAYGAVTQLVFTTQPDGNATGGKPFPAQPVVTAEDAGGNTVTSYAGPVSLRLKSGTGTSGATLSGCTGSLSNGVTTFSGCSIDKSGPSYQLTATDTTLSADSAPFNVAVGPAAQLVFTTQPDGNATGGKAFPTQPVVTAEDAGGNTVTSYTAAVALRLKSGTGTSGAMLSACTGSLSNGVTTFSGCTIDKSATGYQLTATDNTLSADSASFNVAVGPAAQLLFTTQPDGNATGGKAFPTQAVVTAEDAGGNTVTSYTGTVSLRLKSGTGTTGGVLSGCAGSLSNGVTAFSGCTIDKSGTGYQLTATDTTLSADSAPFNVAVGPAAQLLFTTQPDGNASAGSAFPTQPKLTVQDAGDNTVTTDNSTVTLTITSGTPTAGGPGVLSGCTQTESNGVISFSGCAINTAGNGYKLHATDNSLPAADSAAFNMSTTAPNVAVTYPVNSATYGNNWTGTITGTASANGGLNISSTAVAIDDTTAGKWWSSGSFSATTQTFVPATGTTNWTFALAASNLTSGHTYTVIGRATDSLGNVGTSSTVAFTYSAASASVIGQGAAKSSTINGVKTTNGATDLIVIYCWGGSSCGSSGSTPTITGPFSTVSTQTIQSIVFNGNTKSCVEVVQAVGNGQIGTVSVSFGGGSADSIGFVDLLELSPGVTVKATGTNPASQTVSTSALATLGTTSGLSEIAFVGLDGNQGNDSITPPAGMSVLTPLSGFTNPESNGTIGNNGGNLGMFFAPTAQASATFTLSPLAVDWGTIALGIG